MRLLSALLGSSASAPTHDAPWDAAATWEQATYLSLRRSMRRAWACTTAALSLAFMALLALTLVLPLKEFAPYVVTVDKNTGWLEVTRGLHEGNLTQSEAVTMANIVRCLTARETYDATDYAERYREVGLCMTGRALDQYRRLHEQSNADSPAVRYGFDGIIRVEIGSVNLLSATTALASFRTILEWRGREVVNHWRAAMTFSYTNKQFTMRDRFINPLGFQISSYRRDPDLSPTQE